LNLFSLNRYPLYSQGVNIRVNLSVQPAGGKNEQTGQHLQVERMGAFFSAINWINTVFDSVNSFVLVCGTRLVGPAHGAGFHTSFGGKY